MKQISIVYICGYNNIIKAIVTGLVLALSSSGPTANTTQHTWVVVVVDKTAVYWYLHETSSLGGSYDHMWGILALGSIDRLIMTIIAQQTNDRSTIASGSASKTSLEVWTFMKLMLANKLDIFSYGHLTRRMGEGSCFPHNPHPERRRRHTLPIRILADWHAIHIRFEYTMWAHCQLYRLIIIWSSTWLTALWNVCLCNRIAVSPCA